MLRHFYSGVPEPKIPQRFFGESEEMSEVPRTPRRSITKVFQENRCENFI